jgi:uncharacterized protein YcbX
MPAISQLYIYPIKSCAGIALNEARLLATGFEHDRTWMVTDPDGAMLTQRALPRMALIEPRFDAHELVIRAPGMPELRTPLDAGALTAPRKVQTRVWGDTAHGLDTGAESAAWFSTFLGVPARLLRFDPSTERIVDPDYTGSLSATTQFSDGFPLLVIGQASLDDLNARLTRKGAPPILMNRFRPNLVLSGLDPCEEDYVGSLSADPADPADLDGSAETVAMQVQLQLVKLCARCPIPTVDQARGAPDPDWPNEPLDTMSVYRAKAQRGGALTFGNNAIIVQGAGAWLRVGQHVDAELGFGD